MRSVKPSTRTRSSAAKRARELRAARRRGSRTARATSAPAAQRLLGRPRRGRRPPSRRPRPRRPGRRRQVERAPRASRDGGSAKRGSFEPAHVRALGARARRSPAPPASTPAWVTRCRSKPGRAQKRQRGEVGDRRDRRDREPAVRAAGGRAPRSSRGRSRSTTSGAPLGERRSTCGRRALAQAAGDAARERDVVQQPHLEVEEPVGSGDSNDGGVDRALDEAAGERERVERPRPPPRARRQLVAEHLGGQVVAGPDRGGEDHAAHRGTHASLAG